MTAFLTDPAEVLFAAAEHIERHGHHVGDFAPEGRGGDPKAPCCVVGAINVVTAGQPSIADQDGDVLAGQLAKAALVDHLRLLPIEYLDERNQWEEAQLEAHRAGEEFDEVEPSPPDADDMLAQWNDSRTDWQVISGVRQVAAAIGARAQQ